MFMLYGLIPKERAYPVRSLPQLRYRPLYLFLRHVGGQCARRYRRNYPPFPIPDRHRRAVVIQDILIPVPSGFLFPYTPQFLKQPPAVRYRIGCIRLQPSCPFYHAKDLFLGKLRAQYLPQTRAMERNHLAWREISARQPVAVYPVHHDYLIAVPHPEIDVRLREAAPQHLKIRHRELADLQRLQGHAGKLQHLQGQ